MKWVQLNFFFRIRGYLGSQDERQLQDPDFLDSTRKGKVHAQEKSSLVDDLPNFIIFIEIQKQDFCKY
jgi:hypothetical protein